MAVCDIKKNFFQYLFIWLCQVLVVAFRIFVAACGIEFPDEGSNPGAPHWEQRVLVSRSVVSDSSQLRGL